MNTKASPKWWKKQYSKILFIVVFIVVSFFLGTRFGSKNNTAETHDHAVNKNSEPTAWTCSMHPAVQLPKFGQCPICFMDLIPLEAGSDTDPDASILTMSESAKKLAGIMTAPVVRKAVASEIKMIGRVALDESRIEKITARISGRIDRLYVEYTGIRVSEGDHLAEIYSPELLSLQRELLEAAQAVTNLQQGAGGMVAQSIRKNLEATKEKVRLLGFTETEINKVLNRNRISDHMTIRSTQRGIVLQKLIEEGQYVKVGTPLFQIADLRKVWVTLDAYESDLIWLRLGQVVSFTVQAYPGKKFTGKISFIDPLVNPKTRTIMIRVVTNNSNAMLKPDMFVKAEVQISVSKTGKIMSSSIRNKYLCPMHPEVVEKHPGSCSICYMDLVPASEMGYVTSGHGNKSPLIIPSSAPLFTGERAIVYVEDTEAEKPSFEGKEVVLGPRVGSHYIVASGLSEGDMVVVNGAFRIDGELQIRAKPSMMNPKVKKPKISFAAERSVSKLTEPINLSVRKSLEAIFIQYLHLSDALAADDYKNTKKAMYLLKKEIDKTVIPKGQKYKQLGQSIPKMKNRLAKLNYVKTIDESRSLFETLSTETILLEKSYGHDEKRDYNLTFCPMAFDNKGAYWLQTSSVVNNPYYGSKMLKCGTIKETYPSNKAMAKLIPPSKQAMSKEKTSKKTREIKIVSIQRGEHKKLNPLYTQYLSIADALAADNFSATKKSIQDFKKAVEGFSYSPDNKGTMLEKLIQQLRQKFSSITVIKSIEEARVLFEDLSKLTIALEKQYGHSLKENIHLTYCPMAFNNKGAFWLQTKNVVNNPYYGSKMLKCGSIEATHKPKN